MLGEFVLAMRILHSIHEDILYLITQLLIGIPSLFPSLHVILWHLVITDSRPICGGVQTSNSDVLSRDSKMKNLLQLDIAMHWLSCSTPTSEASQLNNLHSKPGRIWEKESDSESRSSYMHVATVHASCIFVQSTYYLVDHQILRIFDH